MILFLNAYLNLLLIQSILELITLYTKKFVITFC